MRTGTIILIAAGGLIGFLLGKSSKQPIVFVLVGAGLGLGADFMFGAQLQGLVGRRGISLPSRGGGLGNIGGLIASTLPWLGLTVKLLGFYFGGKREKEFSVLAGIAASVAAYTAFEWALSLIPGLSPSARAMAGAGGTGDFLGIVKTTLGFAGSWFTQWPFLN